ncbi:hypothetical protein B0F90DRAFT_1818672 [Multifurca ochricompacta]|uniref:Uncharacterized protein n=1 Tax=Multifurca ochricompacta TaxID=376703 RepID=A0AAD4M3Q5_9AGAM|nr:hypothetical protein B0F90DRAFT_1818672 [Multifurca ochricompacta]
MVDWNNPHIILSESLALIKLIHATDGIYIWEYFTTLWFEWEVLSRKRSWKPSMAIYFITRLAALAGVCAELVGFNLTVQFDCQAWLFTVLISQDRQITCYLAFALNSLLILIRTISIWERKLFISLFLTAIWLTNVAFLIYGVAIAKSVWFPLAGSCLILGSQKAKINVLVSAVTDLILLFAMIIGVMRLKSDSSIWRMLYRHGMLWIVLATVGQVPPTVFLFLNLNQPMNLMFQTPALVIMTICSTRLYRSLVGFQRRPAVFDSFLTSAPLASVPPLPRNVRLPRSSGGTPSMTTGSSVSATTGSLDVEFPTSYGRYRAEDLELIDDRLKVIKEEAD